MKVLSGISVLALLIAGAATPSFATTLTPGNVVTPGVVTGFGSFLADTGEIAFSFGGDTGTVREVVLDDFSASPFTGDITFIYAITVTGGNILNLTTASFAIPGISIDVAQANESISGPPQPTTPAATASLTSNGATLGFGFTPPDGLVPGDTSYALIINTNLTTYQAGVFSLQDGQTQNFEGYVPGAPTPEPSTLSLLGTGLLAAGAGLRRKMRRA